MAFLEFLGILFVLYLITQILIPAIWPTLFQKNWVFKKKKPIDETVKKLADKKALLNNDIAEVKKQTADEVAKINRANEDVNNL